MLLNKFLVRLTEKKKSKNDHLALREAAELNGEAVLFQDTTTRGKKNGLENNSHTNSLCETGDTAGWKERDLRLILKRFYTYWKACMLQF